MPPGTLKTPTHHSEHEIDVPIIEEHGVKHSVLVHQDKNKHTWTALPEVKRVGCYRVFDNHEHYSPPPMNNLTGARRSSKFLADEQVRRLSGSNNLPNLPPVVTSPASGKGSMRRASFSPDVAVAEAVPGDGAHIYPAKHVHMDEDKDVMDVRLEEERSYGLTKAIVSGANPALFVSV